MRIVMTDFALSHFDATEHQPAIPGLSPEEFVAKINEMEPLCIQEGYAPFCKLLFYANWTKALCGIIPVTEASNTLIRTGYEARRETELPVLVRYIPGENLHPEAFAEYLCVIVYDKEQMAKEGTPIEGDYAVVNILRLMELEEPPIPPITMMRNALGVAEGGSGVPLDREKYLTSVAFWERHVAVKPRENT